MRSHRGSWLGSCLLAAGLVLAPGLSPSARAQPGFGLDPFWPYNSQYTAYTTPIGPASPAGGQGGAMLPRSGVSGANQFQSYLNGIQGADRTISDRANIGTPYYRSAVDASANPRFSREYTPNALANAQFERRQRDVADKYFAYFSERDPKRRAQLLNDYREARRDASRSLNIRGRSRAAVAEAADRADDPSGRAGRPGSGMDSVLSRGGRSARGATGGLGPAPAVPTTTPSRSAPSASSRTRRTSPTDTYNRSRAMDRFDRTTPESRTTTRRRVGPAPSPTLPLDDPAFP